MKKKEIIVIGGGASGMMAATHVMWYSNLSQIISLLSF